MLTFGGEVVAPIWRELRAAGALTQVTLTTVTTSVDYATGIVTTTPSTPETPRALIGPFRPDEVDGVRIAVADRKVLIPVADVATPPTLSTTVTWAGEEWHCQAKPEKVSNDGLWQLHVRQIGEV